MVCEVSKYQLYTRIILLKLPLNQNVRKIKKKYSSYFLIFVKFGREIVINV